MNRTPIRDNYLPIGMIPPQAIDFEEAVIGALMLEQDALDKVIGMLKPEIFYKEANQFIVTAILNIKRKLNPVDLLTVVEELKSMGKLDAIGGPYYLTQLTNRIASAANIEHHIRIILQKYTLREIIQGASELQKLAYLDETDFNEATEKVNEYCVKINEINSGGGTLNHISVALQKANDDMIKRNENFRNGNTNGIPTGLSALDYATNGWQKGDSIIMAARPAMGKTAMLLHMAKQAAISGENVAIFSLEMSDLKLVHRLILSYMSIEPYRYRQGNLQEYEWNQFHKALTELQSLPIYIDDNSMSSMDTIKATATTLNKKGLCDLVFIDYLQLTEMDTSNKNKNREQEVSQASKKAKQIAKSLNIPVVTLCQLSRAVETRGGNKKPILSDLRDSGSIEQDADLVMFLYRPEYYKVLQDESGNSTKGIGQILIEKNRDGACCHVNFYYNESMTKITNYDPFEVEQIKIKPNKDFTESNNQPF